MKSVQNFLAFKSLMLFTMSLVIFSGCQKDIKETLHSKTVEEVGMENRDDASGHLKQTKTFSSEVAMKWQAMQLRMLRISGANIFGMNGNRYFAYTGIALYEAVMPGMPAYQSLYGQLQGMPAMPSTQPGKAYHWPTSANAALAFLNKSFYTNTTAANRASMDSLELALTQAYQLEINNDEEFQRSVEFGTTVAQRIFAWSQSDGSLTAYPTYSIPPTGATGLWSPTAPNPTAVFAPYWGNNRLFVQGSLSGTSSPLPPAYSTDPNSAYYAMVKEVYDISKTLTTEQANTALYFRDNPGFQAGTHYISIFNQVMQAENPKLDFYAIAHAKTGISIAEAQIGCWKDKYAILVDRPVRYIKAFIDPSWNPLLATPPHPEFPSGHSQTGGAFAAALISMYGDNYPITLRTYDNLNMAPRSYTSFTTMVEDIGKSRVYGGIHFSYTCIESAKQGSKIALNVLSRLKFKK